MKLTPAINFINVKRAHFSYKFFDKAKTKLEKLPKQCLNKKFVSKLLMKLTPGYFQDAKK